MPFPSEVGAPGDIYIESTSALAAKVNGAVLAGAVGRIRCRPAVPLPPTATGPLPASGAEVLLNAALASNPFAHQDPLDPVNLWALMRYFWAFDTEPKMRSSMLKLHDRTERIRHHHRSVMSEYVGIGVGSLVAKRWLEEHTGKAVHAVDAEAALVGAIQVAGVEAVGTMRPDVFLLVEGGPMVVLECKGSGTRAKRELTLARALRQVESVMYDGVLPRGIAVHTTASCSGIFAAVVLSENREAWVTSDVERVEETLIPTNDNRDISGAGVFRGDLDRLADASLLSWAGEEEAAVDALPSRLNRLVRDRAINNAAQTSRSLRGREYVGVESRVDLGSDRVRLFRGIESNVRTLLRRTRGETSGERADIMGDLAREHREHFEFGDNTEAVAVTSSGAALVVSQV